MSILSHLRKSRQQAKEHNAKLVEQEKKEQQHKVPYRHVPTHAAIDAFACAPPSWREVDRPRILKENRRRSAMAASGHHMNMPGAPRVGSGLSHVTYPGENASPVVHLPRPRSYTSITPYLDRNNGQVVYAVPAMSYSQPASLKGKDIVRAGGCDTTRTRSPTPSGGGPSSVGSSNGSSSSQDDLEMRSSRLSARPAESTHRARCNHHRRFSDASIDRFAMINSSKGASSSHVRDSRPPPSMRGFASMAQTAVSSPVQQCLPTPATSSQLAPPSGPASGTLASRQSSTASLPALTPASSRPASSTLVTPLFATASSSECSSDLPLVPHVELGTTRTSEAAASPKSKDKRLARSTRFSELERIESTAAEPAYQVDSRAHPSRHPGPVAHEDLVNVFPEPITLPEPTASSNKSKRLSRGGGGLFNKRWSSSKAPAVVT